MDRIVGLGDFDSRGRSREAWLAGLELADWAEVSLAEAVEACNSESVGLTWSQLPLLSALVVLRHWQLPLGEGLFSIRRPAADACSRLVVISWQKVVADLREERFEYADITPHCFVWTLLDVEINSLQSQFRAKEQTVTEQKRV